MCAFTPQTYASISRSTAMVLRNDRAHLFRPWYRRHYCLGNAITCLGVHYRNPHRLILRNPYWDDSSNYKRSGWLKVSFHRECCVAGDMRTKLMTLPFFQCFYRIDHRVRPAFGPGASPMPSRGATCCMLHPTALTQRLIIRYMLPGRPVATMIFKT